MSLQRVIQLSALLIGCALLPVTSHAQLSFESHPVAPAGTVTVHGDFNNDGREDLVVGNQLYLSTGDGIYQAPITLPASIGAIGDFNHDGKLDFVSYVPASTSVVVFLGNGNGTFQGPKTVTTINPAGLNFQSVLAVDLNHDSKTDLATVTSTNTTSGSPTTIQIWLSNGDGTFSKGQATTTTNPADATVQITNALSGDFDGDGKPDIALIYDFIGPTTVQVFYGDGAGNVGTPYAITDPNGYSSGPFLVADLNNDGRSDLIAPAFVPSGRYGSTQSLPILPLFIGNANRTMTYGTIATTQCAGHLAVADFNGDGLNDLAYNESACDLSSPNTEVVVRLGSGSGKFGAEQTVYQNLYSLGATSAIRSTTGTKPDLIFGQSNAVGNNGSVLLTNTSTSSFPGCGLSGIAEGVQICTPGASSTSPVKFSVAAAGPTPMRTAAVWVDGKKVVEQLTHAFSNYSFLDASLPLAAGSHAITVFGTGWDNTLQQKSFTLTVGSGGSCPAPSGTGVNLCQPANGATVSSPVTIQATSKVTGTLARMELWIDGVKKYTETTSPTLTYSVSLAAGSHRFAVFAVNTAGAKWETFDNATVK